MRFIHYLLGIVILIFSCKKSDNIENLSQEKSECSNFQEIEYAVEMTRAISQTGCIENSSIFLDNEILLDTTFVMIEDLEMFYLYFECHDESNVSEELFDNAIYVFGRFMGTDEAYHLDVDLFEKCNSILIDMRISRSLNITSYHDYSIDFIEPISKKYSGYEIEYQIAEL